MAFSKASFGIDESELVKNSSTFTLPRPAKMRGFPSERLTLARHLPGFCSNAFTINCLYSTADPRRIRSAPRIARVKPSRIQLNPRNLGGILLLQSWLRSSVTVWGVSWQRALSFLIVRTATPSIKSSKLKPALKQSIARYPVVFASARFRGAKANSS
jgi:hypothetical protein